MKQKMSREEVNKILKYIHICEILFKSKKKKKIFNYGFQKNKQANIIRLIINIL